MADRAVLLDTGVIVALANAADPDHAACVDAWARLRAPLVTVEGVLVEAAHILRRARGGSATAIGLVRSSGAEIALPTDERYARATELMRKYHDVPDLVDALLVAVAEERGLREVLTLDRRGFSTYRVKGRTSFRITP